MAGIEILVDRERCICAQNCARAAPATFEIGEDDIAIVLPQPHDAAAAIEEAVRACPVRALSIRAFGHIQGERG